VRALAAAAAALALLASPTVASSSTDLPFSFKPDTGNQASLQKGARNYMAYCAGCHSLKFLRYNRIGKDLGIPEELLKQHLMPEGAKPGDVIKTAMPAAESEKWFGRTPPDLSLTARERGPDWIYSYLLGFYLDPSKPTGVNNLVLPGAAMPHVLGGLQGWQVLEKADPSHSDHHGPNLKLVQPGSLSPAEYQGFVGDLTNFMVYAAEPGRNARISLGWKVLAYVLLFWVMAYLLKKEYWKDVP
jgi:ubiquinol-cytochrome c reductase cytochrome c1 subunit